MILKTVLTASLATTSLLSLTLRGSSTPTTILSVSLCCRGGSHFHASVVALTERWKVKNISIFRYSRGWHKSATSCVLLAWSPWAAMRSPTLTRVTLPVTPGSSPQDRARRDGVTQRNIFIFHTSTNSTIGVGVVKIFRSYIFYICHVHDLLCKKTSLVLVLF